MDLEAIRKAALKLAKMMGFQEHAEDIASAVVLGYLESPNKRQSVKQAIIDELRIMFPGSRYGRRVKFRTIDNESDDFYTAPEQETLAIIKEKYEHNEIALMYDIYNFTFKEIGLFLGVSEATACNRYHAWARLRSKEDK